jgi:tetratricopeptide (TPR) repeat protein
MNKRGSGVFSMIINHRFAVAFGLVFHVCLWPLRHDQLVYAQGGVRARDRAIESKPGSSRGRGSGERKGKSYRLLVTTDPVAECKLLITTRYNDKDTNLVGVVVLNAKAQPRLRQGNYSLSAQCMGYETYSTVVNVPNDISKPISMPLVPLSVRIVLVTDPVEAEVSIDRQPVGRSGADGSLRLPALKVGRYQLSVRKESHVQLITEFEVNKDSRTLQIKLKRDESIPRFESLQAALLDDRLQDALDLYEALAKENFDPARLRPLVWTLLDKLNQRSSQTLEQVGPGGLTLSEAQVAGMRKLYSQAQGLLAKEAPQGDRTLALFEAFWEIKLLIASQHDSQGGFNTQQVAELRALLDKIEAFNPNNPYLMFEVAYVYLRLQNVPRSERAFQDAIASKPDWASPYFGLAVLHMNEAYAVKNEKRIFRLRLLRAAQEFEKSLTMDQRLIHAYVMASFCYADAGEAKRAKKIALQALKINPESGLLKYALGYAYFVSGRNDYVSARLHLGAALSATQDRLDSAQVAHVKEILNRMFERRK